MGASSSGRLRHELGTLLLKDLRAWLRYEDLRCVVSRAHLRLWVIAIEFADQGMTIGRGLLFQNGYKGLN